jgi:hypothetical protein
VAFSYTKADRAGSLLAEIQAIDPVSLQNDRDRAARSYLIAVLTTLPATFGVAVSANNDDANQMVVSIRHQPFGSYAS